MKLYDDLMAATRYAVMMLREAKTLEPSPPFVMRVSLAVIGYRAKEFELAAFLGPKGELYVEDNVSDVFWCAAGQESARPRRER